MNRRPPLPMAALRGFALLLLAGLLLPAGVRADTFSPQGSSAEPLSFRVKWDGHIIAEVAKISGFARHTEVVTSRGGGDPNSARHSPGPSRYEPIVLERRLTSDPEFERWANKVWTFGAGLGAEASLRDYRKDIIIELYNALGETVMAFRVYRCWPSDYSVIGEMDAGNPSLPVEVLVLQHEGWERDHEVLSPH